VVVVYDTGDLAGGPLRGTTGHDRGIVGVGGNLILGFARMVMGLWYDLFMIERYKHILGSLKDPAVLEQLSESDKLSLMQWLEHVRYEWSLHARPSQIMPPGRWTTWLILSGRGYGKSRVGAETVRQLVTKHGYRAVGLIAPTASDARDTMIDGKGGSSLLEVSPPSDGLEYFPTKRKLTWKNGAKGSAFSAEEPDRLRGPQNDLIWSDELASWRYLQETWDMAMFGLRLGKSPKHIITTTPRPLPMLKDLLAGSVPADEMRDDMTASVVVTRGSTFENKDNLADDFINTLMKKYEGTRLGRQELYAEVLDDNPNGIFRQFRVDNNRVRIKHGSYFNKSKVIFEFVLSQGNERAQEFETLFSEVIIAIDPSMTSDKKSNETGIVVMAVDKDNRVYLLEDASGVMTPNEWASRALKLYEKYKANAIVAEVNQGGDLVENTIRTAQRDLGVSNVTYKKVRASKGKFARAEPVGALEEQGRIHHVGDFARLEEQLVTFSPHTTNSPDRLDAYVWAVHHLVIQREKKGFFIF
jgi:predicted phage terminase large subunit-like protein